MSEKHYLTKEKLKELEDELKELIGVRRKEIAERLREAVALGDLTENSEYQEAKEAQGFLEGRIRELQDTITNHEIIKEHASGQRTIVGSRVRIRRIGSEKIEEFTIVGSEEAEPVKHRISNESPIGRTLINKIRGERCEVQTPQGIVSYEIIEVS